VVTEPEEPEVTEVQEITEVEEQEEELQECLDHSPSSFEKGKPCSPNFLLIIYIS
jgi:hypothetical protein